MAYVLMWMEIQWDFKELLHIISYTTLISMEICEFFKDFYTHNGYRENRISNVVVPKKLSPFLG